METKSKKSKSGKTKPATKKKVVKKQTVKQVAEPIKSDYTLLYWISFPFRLLIAPFYLLYKLLFKVPESPVNMLGLFRFIVFVYIALNRDVVKNFITSHFSENNTTIVLGIFSLLMLVNLFLSFMETFGFHDATRSGYVSPNSYVPAYVNSNSGSRYQNIEDGIEYRDSYLKALHTPGKVAELQKTGFITNGRLSELSQSPEMSEALEFLDTRMGCLHNPGKYELMKEMFGGKGKI